ncbi:MAG: hypothetical protein ACI89D_001867 [Bermanella sp.]|jgi:hypothetical protein
MDGVKQAAPERFARSIATAKYNIAEDWGDTSLKPYFAEALI